MAPFSCVITKVKVSQATQIRLRSMAGYSSVVFDALLWWSRVAGGGNSWAPDPGGSLLPGALHGSLISAHTCSLSLSPAGMGLPISRCVALGLGYSWGLCMARFSWINLYLPLTPGWCYCSFSISSTFHDKDTHTLTFDTLCLSFFFILRHTHTRRSISNFFLLQLAI